MFIDLTGKLSSRRRREISDAIREVLMDQWDPIGVKGIPEAADEYDGYIGGVYRLLVSMADAQQIANHLAAIQTKNMGLPQKAENLVTLAERLRSINVEP